MLVTALGEPVPPQSVVKRLAAVDERLSIKWVPSVVGAYWGIIERWRSEDPRWQDVRNGIVREQDAFDLRAMLPGDCSAEEAEGFVLRHFERVSRPDQQAEKQVDRIVKHNRATKQKHVESFLEEQEHKTIRTSKHEHEVNLGVATAHPISHGIGDSPRTKRRKAAQAGGESA
jgi:hypothetical protein